MKEYYKIGEISKIYGIGTDSLRYYEELGILRPKRDFNGYRMYSIRDIRVLNIIRELRSVGFSILEIKEHLKDFNLEKTLELFLKEQKTINKKIEELQNLKEQMDMRIEDIKYHLSLEHEREKFVIEEHPKRYVIKLSDNALREDDLDFVIKRLQLENQDKLYIIGNGDIGGSIPSLEYLQAGDYGLYDSVFYIVDENEGYDDVIEGGKYLTLLVKGPYSNIPDGWAKLLRYADENDLKLVGKPTEMYLVDNHDTSDEREYMTRLEVRLCDEIG